MSEFKYSRLHVAKWFAFTGVVAYAFLGIGAIFIPIFEMISYLRYGYALNYRNLFGALSAIIVWLLIGGVHWAFAYLLLFPNRSRLGFVLKSFLVSLLSSVCIICLLGFVSTGDVYGPAVVEAYLFLFSLYAMTIAPLITSFLCYLIFETKMGNAREK